MTEPRAPRPAARWRPTTGNPQELLRALAALPERHPSRALVRAQAIEAWLPLAHHLALRFVGRGEPLPDLTQTAVVGLIKAVDRFDASRGNGFVAFAVPTIVGEIRRYFRDQAWTLHVPRRSQELRMAVADATEALTQRLGHPPTPTELAEDLGLPVADVREGMSVARAYSTTSLDAPPPGGGNGEPGPVLGELIGQEDPALARAELRLAMAPALAALPERERRILRLRFFGNLTQDQIADRVGISQMHVSRLLARTLHTLRDELRAEHFTTTSQR